MVYRLLYYLVNILIRVFYRKLYINGLDKIDKSKTYLITSNHPNGFFEPLIMACTFPIDLYFMVRGDMFENSAMNWFLRSTHQIPIYRFTDGFANMKKNQASMDEAIDNLNNGHSILVFAEGSTKAVMKCRPIQKGTAKMAFQTFDKYPQKELYILPIGINFNDWRDPGNEVVLNVGTPFLANTYYKEDKAVSSRLLTKSIEAEMKKLIIEVEEPQEELVRKFWALLNLTKADWPRKDESFAFYDKIKQFADKIDDESITDKVIALYKKASDLIKGRRPKGIKSNWHLFYGILGIPGLFFHFLPVYSGYIMRNKKVRRDAFAAPVLGITAFGATVALYVLVLLIGSFLFGTINTLAFLIIIGISGFCFLLFWENQFKITLSQYQEEIEHELEEIILCLDR